MHDDPTYDLRPQYAYQRTGATLRNPFKSRTLWLNVLAGAAAILWPAAQELIQQHPAWVNGSLAVLNIALRFLTIQPVSFVADAPVIKR